VSTRTWGQDDRASVFIGCARSRHKFYAVRHGRTCRLYFNWLDCSREVIDFKGAEHKSFGSLVQVEDYLFRVRDS